MNHRRVSRLARGLLLLTCCLLPACQQRMASQPSYRPDEPSSFFPDGRADRPLVPGTVARGQLRTDLHLYTGRRTRQGQALAAPAALVGEAGRGALGVLGMLAVEEADFVDTFPFPITQRVLEHGRHRYMIFCVVCHDPLGTGHGKIVERGYTQPPSYHIERLRQAPVGHFFQVITDGYGSMPDYRQQIPPRDRWAIVAYIRALQLSQHFPEKDLPPDLREKFDKPQEAAAGGQPR
jgi:hypothetical protein